MAEDSNELIRATLTQLTREATLNAANLIPRGIVGRVMPREVVRSFREALLSDAVTVNGGPSFSSSMVPGVVVNGFAEPNPNGSDFEVVFQESNFDGVGNGGGTLVSEMGAGGSNVGLGNGLTVSGGIDGMGFSSTDSVVVNDVRISEPTLSTPDVSLPSGDPVRSVSTHLGVSVGMNSDANVGVRTLLGSSSSHGRGVRRVNSLAELGVGVVSNVGGNAVSINGGDSRSGGLVGTNGVTNVGGANVGDNRSEAVRAIPSDSSVRGNGNVVNGVVFEVPPMVSEGMVSGQRANVSAEVIIGTGTSSGMAARNVVNGYNRDTVLDWFEEEVRADLNRIRVYRNLSRELRGVVRSRRERIRRLSTFNNAEALEILRFMDRMQHEDNAKGSTALLYMREAEVKIGQKASLMMNLRRRRGH